MHVIRKTLCVCSAQGMNTAIRGLITLVSSPPTGQNNSYTGDEFAQWVCSFWPRLAVNAQSQYIFATKVLTCTCVIGPILLTANKALPLAHVRGAFIEVRVQFFPWYHCEILRSHGVQHTGEALGGHRFGTMLNQFLYQLYKYCSQERLTFSQLSPEGKLICFGLHGFISFAVLIHIHSYSV